MTKQEKQQKEKLFEFWYNSYYTDGDDKLTEIWSVALNSNDE